MSILNEIKDGLGKKILDWHEHSPKRIYISVKPQEIKEVANFLFKELKLRFATASAGDTPKGFEILYHFSFDKSGEMITVRVILENKQKPEVESIASLFKGAEWIEREIWELLGINFIGHPNLTHLLLVEDWPEGKFPLRHEHKEEGNK